MPSKFQSHIHAAALALLTASVGAHAAGIDQADDILSRRVSYADLDITHRTGVAVLYTRITSAAHQVCEPSVQWEPKLLQAGSRCATAAVSRAVSEIGSPLLTTYYLERTSAPAR